jgi:hypothetical protein
VTALELTTLSFVLVLVATQYCWLHKPSGVSRPVILDTKYTIHQIRLDVSTLVLT